MTDKWREYRWGDLATLEYGKGLRGYKDSIGTYPVYGTNGLIGRHTEPLCPHSGVIIGRKGAYRGVHYSEKPFFVIDTAFYLEPKADIDLKWAYYQLLTQNINSMDSGSAIPSTSRDAFYNLPVKVPSLPEQKTIALILGALDDKIELNRKMNETLEAMARAIFKSWFVDFDPIPGLGPHKEWQDSPLGKIPKGWRVGSLGELCENHRVGVNPEDMKPGTPYIGLEHMPRRSIALSEWGIADNVVSNKFLFKKGEILFGKLRPYFHKVGVAAMDGVCSTDILVINSKNIALYGLVLSHLSSDDFVNYTEGTSSGTKMPRTNWTDIARYRIMIPPETIARKFTDSVLHMIHTIQFNIHQSRNLATIRDALLPKLLSGEIRVKGAERFLERIIDV